MPLLGERHENWVNDMKRVKVRHLGIRDRIIAFALVLIILIFFFQEASFFYQPHSAPIKNWLYLDTPSDRIPSAKDGGWTNEPPASGNYWIMTSVELDGTEEFNSIRATFPDHHTLFWDGYLIGHHSRSPAQGLSRIYPLDNHHLIEGIHQVLVRVERERVGFIRLWRNELVLDRIDRFNAIAMVRTFLLIGCLGLLGLIIIWGLRHTYFFKDHPGWVVGSMTVIATYIGFLFIDVLHHRPSDWGDPSLMLITTASCIQLIMVLSNRLGKTLFGTFSWVALGSYALIYFILDNHDEQVILYLLSLWLTLFIFLFAHAKRRWEIIWSLTPVIPFLLDVPWVGYLLVTTPMVFLLIYQIFEIGETGNLEGKEDINEIVEPDEQVSYLLVNSKSEKKSVPLYDVEMIKAANNYAVIILQSGDTFLHDKSLLKLSTELPENFRRVHKSYLVNLDKVELVKNKPGGGKLLQMNSGEEVPVGRVYTKELNTLFA